MRFLEIHSPKGPLYAIVDDVDYESVARFRWYSRDRYPCRQSRVHEGTRRFLVTMSRWLLGLGPDDKRIVHHVNGNPLDNRRENLQICASAKEHMRIHAAQRRDRVTV